MLFSCRSHLIRTVKLHLLILYEVLSLLKAQDEKNLKIDIIGTRSMLVFTHVNSTNNYLISVVGKFLVL